MLLAGGHEFPEHGPRNPVGFGIMATVVVFEPLFPALPELVWLAGSEPVAAAIEVVMTTVLGVAHAEQ